MNYYDSLNDKFKKLQVTMMVTKLGFKKESFDGYLSALKKVEVGTESIDELNARVAENKEKQTKLDIKNDKGYVLAPPSKVPCDGSKHQDNQPCNKSLYKTLHTSQENIKILPFEEWQQ